MRMTIFVSIAPTTTIGKAIFFYDQRFDLLHAADEQFLIFLCEVFHPAVRFERHNWELFLNRINQLLNADGFSIIKKYQVSGRVVFGWTRIDQQDAIIMDQSEDIEV